MKVKVKNITPEDLERTKQIQINKCKAALASFPIATRLWLAMKTGISLDFIVKNKKEIYGHD